MQTLKNYLTGRKQQPLQKTLVSDANKLVKTTLVTEMDLHSWLSRGVGKWFQLLENNICIR